MLCFLYMVWIQYFLLNSYVSQFYQWPVCPIPDFRHHPSHTLTSWHPCLFSCQPVGSLPASSRPSTHITFHLTGQFIVPNPFQHKGHNGAHSGLLSSLDLQLQSSLAHFLIVESACTDRFWSPGVWKPVGMCARVCVVHECTFTQRWTHTPRVFNRVVLSCGLVSAKSKISVVTPNAPLWAMTGKSTEGGVRESPGSLGACLIIKAHQKRSKNWAKYNRHVNQQNLKPPLYEKSFIYFEKRNRYIYIWKSNFTLLISFDSRHIKQRKR